MAQIRPDMWYVWSNMKQRCFNQNRSEFKNYGGRGITVCDKWLSFFGFKEDMEVGYKKGLTLDRINNDLGYYKENCRWADVKTQMNNQRKSRFIEYNGIKKTVSQWAEYLGIKSSTLRQRFYVYKWSIEKCFNY